MNSEVSSMDPTSDPTSTQEVGTFAERLEEVLESSSARNFAARIGVSEGTLRNLLKGGDPKLSTVLRITTEAGVNIEWLTTGRGSKQVHPLSSNHKQAQPSSITASISNQGFDEEYVLVPGYHLHVSTGNGSAVLDEEVKRYLPFEAKWLKYKQVRLDKLAVVFSKGDSMEPTIKDNDNLLIDLASREPKEGKIFVVRLGDDLYAKRVQRLVDGGLVLISDNKEYQSLTISPDRLDQLQVIGQVIWIGKDV